MVIIGGLGSILGSVPGAAFIVLRADLPDQRASPGRAALPVALQKQIELMVFGASSSSS
jgi:ABC-type branched-subunit amino acid transport system permease subunit